MSNVTLDDVILDKWTTCLTDNFIPNFQKKLNKKPEFNQKPKSKAELAQNFI